MYARTDGYLKAWYFDIGAHVKKGQLLAIIPSRSFDAGVDSEHQDHISSWNLR